MRAVILMWLLLVPVGVVWSGCTEDGAGFCPLTDPSCLEPVPCDECVESCGEDELCLFDCVEDKLSCSICLQPFFDCRESSTSESCETELCSCATCG